MQVPVKDLTGAQVDTIDLNEAVFGVPMRSGVVHQALVRQRANARQGTSDTKTRSEVKGSGKKPWAQKHTGRARAGDKRSPLWRHGGIIFGPHQRDYHQDMPRKMRRLALKCMLSDKQSTGTLVVLKDLNLAEGKTKEIAKVLEALKLEGSVLMVPAVADAKLAKATRNLEKVKSLPASTLSVGDLLKYQHLVMTVDAVKKAEELWVRDIDRRRVAETVEAPTSNRPRPARRSAA